VLKVTAIAAYYARRNKYFTFFHFYEIYVIILYKYILL
jgi:hypothetical protein